MAKNPSLKNKKLKVHDYDSITKMQTATVSAIQECNRIDEVEKTMKKYRSQRNKALAATAVITIAASVGLTWMHKSKNKKLKTVMDTNDVLTSSIEKLQNSYSELENKHNDFKAKAKESNQRKKEKIESQQRQIKYLAAKVKGDEQAAKNVRRSGTVANMKKVANDVKGTAQGAATKTKDMVLEKTKIKCLTEVIDNAASDIKSGTMEIYGALTDANKSTLAKASSVVSGVSTIVNAPRDAVNPEKQIEKRRKGLQSNLEKFNKMDDFFTKMKKNYNSISDPDEKKRWKKQFDAKYGQTFKDYLALKKELKM